MASMAGGSNIGVLDTYWADFDGDFLVKTLISLNWQLHPKLWDYAVKHNMPKGKVDAEVEKFIDHHRKKQNKFEWDAAWREWVRRAEKYNGWVPLRDDGKPLVKRAPEGPVSLSERYPIPEGHLFKRNIRSHTETERERCEAWRQKTLEALLETGLTGRAACEWMQQRMQKAARG